MQDDQKHGRILGVLFIITFITSISAAVLFQSVLDDPAGYIAGGGKDNQLWPGHRLRRCANHRVCFHRGRDHLRARAVSLRQDSPDAADLAVSLAQLKDWTFLFGPGLVGPFGNGLILGYLMYKSGLVHRRMASASTAPSGGSGRTLRSFAQATRPNQWTSRQLNLQGRAVA